MKVWGQLENAQLENKAVDYAAGVIGRMWWNTATSKVMNDDGTSIRAMLRNDGNCIIGNSVTPASNIRFHRGAAGLLQVVTGNDATVEGTLSTNPAQVDKRVGNFTTIGLPAAASAGRVVWDSTVTWLKVDTGAAWKDVLQGDAAQTVTNKTLLDTTNLWANTADATKKFKWDASGIATATTRTIIVPNRDFTLNLGTDIASAAAASGAVLTADGASGASWVVNSTIGVPVGTVLPFAGTVAPANFLFCDGSSVLRATYPNLFTAIGAAFGSADGTHFNLPDLRGKFARGTDNMGTAAGSAAQDPDTALRTASATGGNTANNVGSVQGDDIKAHTHSLTAQASSSSPNAAAGQQTACTANNTSAFSAFTMGNPSSMVNGNETRPKNVYLNYIIRY